MPVRGDSAFTSTDESERLVGEKVADQKVTVPDIVRLDHEKLKYDYHQLINAQSYDDKERWQNELIRELALHLGAAEVVVFPWVWSLLSQGKEVVNEQERQHEELKQLVRKFQRMKPGGQQYLPTQEQVIRSIESTIQSEDKNVLVPIERTLHTEDSIRKAKCFERKKRFLPTRVHPSRGYHWIFTDIEATFETPINRMGDLRRKFPQKSRRHDGSFESVKRQIQEVS